MIKRQCGWLTKAMWVMYTRVCTANLRIGAMRCLGACLDLHKAGSVRALAGAAEFGEVGNLRDEERFRVKIRATCSRLLKVAAAGAALANGGRLLPWRAAPQHRL